MTWEEAVLWLRAQPEQVELTRACFYDDPVLAAAERYRASSEWCAMREILPRTPGRVLDLGAGRGISSYALAMDGWSTVALEPDPSPVVGCGAVRALRAEGRVPLQITRGLTEALPFRSHSFDVVFGRAVMHHARDLAGFCREAARVLRPGGVFVGAREHVISAGQLPAFLDAHPLHRHYQGENAYRLREYRQALQGAGLRIARLLHPLQSDINLFPDSKAGMRERLSRRLRLPGRVRIPDFVFDLLGRLQRLPGRLYTFVAVKPHA